ncbi:MAG: RrF2 family transcriptional regulator [Anaerolineales bacterium]
MKVSARERISLRAMEELARRFGQGPTALRKVAEAQGLPLPYLGRIAVALRRAGLLKSVRGAHGGYMLSRTPSQISVGDIFRAVEGSIVPLECTGGEGGTCANVSDCAARSVWQTVTRRLEETLDNTSLTDLLQQD